MSSVIAIYRDARFSPNSVAADRSIMDATIDRLGQHQVLAIAEHELGEQHRADLFLSMGRLPRTIQLLKAREQQNRALVINNAAALERFSRRHILQMMQENGIPTPPETGEHGYWVKRADSAAQTKADVVFCSDKATVEQTKRNFALRGVDDVVVSAHVVGDLIKFYGVGDSFFWYFYPTDNGHSKFGNEKRNGIAQHFGFNLPELRAAATRLARLTGIDVYGGDCIVDREGRFFIIDFNDWPSFAACKEQAADAISQLVNGLLATNVKIKQENG